MVYLNVKLECFYISYCPRRILVLLRHWNKQTSNKNELDTESETLALWSLPFFKGSNVLFLKGSELSILFLT